MSDAYAHATARQAPICQHQIGQRHAWLVPSLLLAFSLALTGSLEFQPRPRQPVVVFFAPGTTRDQALAAALQAGANVLALGGWANSLVVQSENPRFFARLHESGAWLIADAIGKAGCISRQGRS